MNKGECLAAAGARERNLSPLPSMVGATLLGGGVGWVLKICGLHACMYPPSAARAMMGNIDKAGSGQEPVLQDRSLGRVVGGSHGAATDGAGSLFATG